MPFTPVQPLNTLEGTSEKTTGFNAVPPVGTGTNVPSPTPTPDKKGFFSRLTQDFKRRTEKGSEAMFASVSDEQTLGEGLFQTVGQGAGFISDTIFNAATSVIKAATPKNVEDAAKQKVSDFFQTPVGQEAMGVLQKGSDAYRRWAQEKPRAARNLESVLGIAEVVPVGKLAGGTVKGGTKLAERLLNPVRQQVSNIAVKDMNRTLNIAPSIATKIQKSNIAGKSAGEWLLERGIKGNRDEIVDQLDEIRTASKQAVDEGLANINVRFNVPQSQQALEIFEKNFTEVPGLEKELARVQELRAKETLTLTELNEVKRMIDDLDLYKVTGDLKSGATVKGLNNIRDDLKTLIEDFASDSGFKDVKRLNKETQVAYEIRNAIAKRETAMTNRRSIGLTDIMVGGGAFAAGANPILTVGIVATKKVLENPKVRTTIANVLADLPDKKIKLIESAYKSGTLNENAKNVLKEIMQKADEKLGGMLNVVGGGKAGTRAMPDASEDMSNESNDSSFNLIKRAEASDENTVNEDLQRGNTVRASDVARYLPGEIGKNVAEVGKEFAKTPIRFGASLIDVPRILVGKEPLPPFDVKGLGTISSSQRAFIDGQANATNELEAVASALNVSSQVILDAATVGKVAEAVSKLKTPLAKMFNDFPKNEGGTIASQPATYDNTLRAVRTSEPFSFDADKIPKEIAERAFARPERLGLVPTKNMTLTPEGALSVSHDIAGKLNQYRHGLGEAFNKIIDLKDTSYNGLVETAETLLKAFK